MGYYVVASPAPPGFPLMRVNKVGDVVVALVVTAWWGFGNLCGGLVWRLMLGLCVPWWGMVLWGRLSPHLLWVWGSVGQGVVGVKVLLVCLVKVMCCLGGCLVQG